jgi:GH43 family beta-xylosidase
VATGGVASGGATSGGTGGTATGGAAGAGGAQSVGGAPATGGVASGGTGGGSGGSGPRTTFRNPLNQDFGPDPWMTYYEGYYYLSATTWDKNHLSMKKGRTIAELKDATPQVIWTPGPAAASKAMWAPEFYLLDNGNGQKRWYFYFTAGDGSADFVAQRSHVLESAGQDPMGPYTYKAQLINYWAIDGSVLQYSGKLYFMFSAWEGPTQNVYIQAMNNPWTVTGNRTRLTMPTYAWEKEGTAQVNEGPAALYHDGRTFVTYSASQCGSPGYKLGLLELTGADPMNAGSWWKSSTPVFQQANGNYGTGHNGFFVSPDGTENWLVYHAVSNANGSCWIDRTTRIQPFAWQANGLPDFGTPLALSTDILSPSGE